MPKFQIDVPVWATLYIEAKDEAEALAKAKDAVANYTTVNVRDDGDLGEGVSLSEVATMHPLPADAQVEEAD